MDNFHEYFEYRDGHLYWKKKAARWIVIGSATAEHRTPNGYMRIGLHRKRYFLHRVIFHMHHGYFPKFVDHINGIRDDNRIENLREATGTQNHANQIKREGLSSQYKGVHWRKDRGKWSAQIKLNRQSIRLGCFSNEEDAARAYDQKATELFGEFAKTNF